MSIGANSTRPQPNPGELGGKTARGARCTSQPKRPLEPGPSAHPFRLLARPCPKKLTKVKGVWQEKLEYSALQSGFLSAINLPSSVVRG